ncbi:hypothetical protein RHSIM_Rhsim11G0014000 [Rhododendron simsii]|uniref:BED-type domain-containing protein n=1 Tax=Rhododendron simsii TaxID=118357 RepID=A0A834G415_RHOSS|nr:hypothetical protein RHSIM_Rhsim11G0014000 [Rhododendron simsii]
MGDSHSGSSDEVARNLIAPQGMGSVGEEAASNVVGGGSGTGPLGSAATPAASTPAATNSGLSGSKRSRRTSWVWNHFTIVNNFKDEQGIDIGQRAVCHYCDTHYKCLSNNGVGPHGRHLQKYHADKIGNASDSNFVYSKEKMRHGLALYVAAAEQPFTFGDDIRFEHFVQNCLNPSFAKVSRNSTRSDTKKAHTEVKKDLISELATVGAIGFTSDMWSGITTLPSSANVYDLLTSMYAKYDSKFRSNAACTAAPLPSSRSTNDEFWDFVSSNLGSSTVTSRIELDKYLDLESVDENDRRDFDVLAWWKINEVKYPVLSIMARDLLTPPVSTVASESAFSAGKRVLDERRSRLAPDILDCLICLKDWEDARLGIQKRSAKDEFRGYFANSDIDSD